MTSYFFEREPALFSRRFIPTGVVDDTGARQAHTYTGIETKK